MSYCRWSSDGGACDVYVYEDVSGGFTCHVAARHIINLAEAPPSPGSILEMKEGEWIEMHRARMEWMDKCAIRENIGLEHDGESFNVETANDMADLLVDLKQKGYNVPDYAIEALREEDNADGTV